MYFSPRVSQYIHIHDTDNFAYIESLHNVDIDSKVENELFLGYCIDSVLCSPEIS